MDLPLLRALLETTEQTPVTTNDSAQPNSESVSGQDRSITSSSASQAQSTFTALQLEALEELYQRNQLLTESKRLPLSRQIGITDEQILTWLYHRIGETARLEGNNETVREWARKQTGGTKILNTKNAIRYFPNTQHVVSHPHSSVAASQPAKTRPSKVKQMSSKESIALLEELFRVSKM